MVDRLETRIGELLALIGKSVPDDINRERIMKEAQDLLGIDSLTGVPNKYALSQRFEEETARAKRHQRPLSVLFLDIDDFKSYNDTYGHEQGDVALKYVASVLGRNVRKEDTVARFGGEEFCLALPEASLDGAVRIASNIVNRVREEKVEKYRSFDDKKNEKYLGERDYHKLTVSVGVANYPRTSNIPSFLINEADHAMYDAKKAGKDRFKVFGANGK